jgi:protein TonB
MAMRMRLPETARRRERRLGGIVTSVTAHGVVILLVVYGTARGTSAPPVPDVAPVPIIYTVPMPPTPLRTERRADETARAGGPAAPASPTVPPIAAPTLPPLSLAMGDVVPPSIPLAGRVATGDEFTGGRERLGATAGLRSGGGDGPLDAYEVDRPAAPRTVVEPRYPESLRTRGIAGSVVVRFVVDSTGRVARSSLEIVEAADPLFAGAVRDALARTRFTPAMAGGRHVAQRVEQRFEFRLH